MSSGMPDILVRKAGEVYNLRESQCLKSLCETRSKVAELFKTYAFCFTSAVCF